MSDRELLELAAKAAGKRGVDWAFDGNRVPVAVLEDGSYWQPLIENQFTDCMGDALRLFCALPWLCIETSDLAATVRERGKPKEQSRVYLMWTEWLDDHNGDLAAATRRAIVRAAAEIGKAMS